MAVSDLCIGKPALRSLSSSATVGETLIALKRSGGGASVGVWSSPEKKEVAGKVSMVDVLCFLCAEKNISSPSAALDAPVSALLSSSDAAIRRVEPHSSILEALEVILDGAQSLVVPIRSNRKKLAGAGAGGGSDLCWLTAEDFVRFFLNSIALFSPLPSHSVSALGIVRPAALAIGYHEPALSALPLLRAAVADQTSVAVVSDDGRLLGEISPSTLVYCDESAAAAIAALSAGELMAYVDFSTAPPEAAIHAVKARLTERGLLGMLDFLDADSSSSSSSSSDEEPAPRKRIRATRSGSYSARMGRRTEESIVCHPRSSLMAVMIQALAHRVSYVWVVDDDYALLGIVGLADMLSVFREQL